MKCQTQIYILDCLDRYPLCITVMNKKISKQVIRQLINIFPEAAKQFDKMQRLPLHYAILCCREYNDCVNDLVGAAPFALSSIDPNTGLYPFMMSASNQSSLSTTYKLLREEPSVLQQQPFCLEPIKRKGTSFFRNV